MKLPEDFIKRMRLLSDSEAFFQSYDLPPVRGIRVNLLKTTPSAFAEGSPFPLGERIPWEESGFYVTEEKVGKTIEHAAGLFYSQEPSAMCAVPLLDLKPGDFFLDLCSAPGGKGTQSAALMQGKGIAVLNEKMPDRAKILAGNVERMGIRNAVVLNADPRELETRFPACFDKILVDAPCSGEGMFKKEENAVGEWSLAKVAMCAERQRGILDSAASMLKEGGILVYSTCTFSPEEDEGQIADFLARHGEFTLLEEHKLYPHRVKGEGHYAAKLLKTAGEIGTWRKETNFLKAAEETVYRTFERSFFVGRQERLFAFGNSISSLPEGCFSLKGLKVLRAGLPLGTIEKGRFEPAHSFAMAYPEECFLGVAEIGEKARSYLRGEPFENEGENGWCVVTFRGFPLGIGKRVNGIVKNHLPKGLRL
ncbi:MAG: RsmF rRNA methyltransferase first C-terminal domain-containing protein [Clostridia bacterium]|nr:RsmF rRNA methyltransferase first C-terminal domain-containing protein [Clostridia bacterium]